MRAHRDRRPPWRLPLAAAAALVALTAAPGTRQAHAHHVGAYTPRDNDVSANFKQIKFSVQAGKFDVARRLYVEGSLRKELRARAQTLPPGLEVSIAGALEARDAGRAEGGLMIFFMALIRELVAEADRHLADTTVAAEARAATGRKLLEAVWRYYNLVDFAVTQRDAKAATGIRLAFEEAEELVKPRSPAPERARAALARIDRLTGAVIEASSTTRRDS
jgi:hypothetical protein